MRWQSSIRVRMLARIGTPVIDVTNAGAFLLIIHARDASTAVKRLPCLLVSYKPLAWLGWRTRDRRINDQGGSALSYLGLTRSRIVSISRVDGSRQSK